MTNPSSDRELGRRAQASAVKSLQAAADSDIPGPALTEASALLLLAIYHELRHGNDLRAGDPG
ncbi:MAG TPA: hypothetical protein VGH99_10980 [Pseudonocardia sp.]|jgi:hypothetical protein